MSEIMKIMNENSKINKGKKEQRGDRSYSENVRVKQFCCAINLGFVQFKVSFINYFKRKGIMEGNNYIFLAGGDALVKLAELMYKQYSTTFV